MLFCIADAKRYWILELHKQPDLINEKLKSLYNSVRDEEIPDRFLQMLEKLDEAERQAKRIGQGKGNES